MNIFDWLACGAVLLGFWLLPVAEEPVRWPALIIIGFGLVFANKAGRVTEARKRGSIRVK